MSFNSLFFSIGFVLSFFYLLLGLVAYGQLNLEQKKKATWALDPTWPFHPYSDTNYSRRLYFHGKWLLVVCTAFALLGLVV